MQSCKFWKRNSLIAAVSFAALLLSLTACNRPASGPATARVPESVVGHVAASAIRNPAAPDSPSSIEDCMKDDDARQRASCLFDFVPQADDRTIWNNNWFPSPAKGLNDFNCLNATSLPVNRSPAADFKLFVDSLDLPVQLRSSTSPALAVQPKGIKHSVMNKAEQVSGPTPPALGQIAGIFFNKSAIQYICGLKGSTPLTGGQPATLNDSLAQRAVPAGRPVPVGQTIDFGQADYPMAVKALWVQVPASPGQAIVPVWDEMNHPDTDNPDISQWKTTVSLVGLPGGSGPSSCKGFALPAQWPRPSPKIPLKCFFSVFADKDQCKAVVDRAAGVGIQPAGLGSEAGCYFILVGFHLAARDPKGGTNGRPWWTWQTYWWSARAGDPSSKDHLRLPDPNRFPLDSEWGHYVMDTTEPAPGTYNGPADSYNVVNPYLEGTFRGGEGTTCSTCHARAAFNTGTPDAVDCQFHNQSGINTSGIPCNPPPAMSLLTDSVWSLADINVTSVGHSSVH